MKCTTLLITVLTLLVFSTSLNAQVKNVEKEAERQGTKRINRKIDKGIDSGFDAIEDGIGSLFGKKKKKKKGKNQTTQESSNNQSQQLAGRSGSSVAGHDPDALYQQYGMYPPDGATDVPLPVTLKWTPMNHADFKAKSYELYLNKEGNYEDGMIGGPIKPQHTCRNLEPNTTYRWRFIGENSDGQYMPGGGGTFTTGNGEASTPKMDVQWSKFDFVPGDEVIFEDGPDIMEENGEFPSRWDLGQGQVEIAQVNGETVMMFLAGGKIMPYLENSEDDYLPDVFTIEFDYYTPKDGNRLSFYLTDIKHQAPSVLQQFDVTPIRVDTPDGNYVEHSGRDYTFCENGCWTHVSLAYTKGKLKVYLDDTRLINIPRYEHNPTGFTIYPYFANASENQAFYVKNVRIAQGGVKYYDRVLNEGKIVCNGIRFDVNKASLKTESMGPINNIYDLMQKQPDLKFSVEGHTDADGDEARNQTLSEQRAKTVMNKLIAMGISADRLRSKGYGESVPVDNNTTAEGKANNRRVEFVKF